MEVLIGAVMGLLTGGISGLFWLAGVASRGNQNTAAIERLEADRQRHEEKVEERFRFVENRHNELDDRVMDKLSNIERIVAKIEGKLDNQ